MDRELAVFGLAHSQKFAEAIADDLGVSPARVNTQWRPDTEPWAASLTNVRGRDVFVISSLHEGAGRSVSDVTMQMLLFIDALRRASAGRITAVCPYLSFMRQDRKEGSREPVSTQALAKFFEAAGADRMLIMDAHNPAAIQNAFRIPVDILEANNALADAVVDKWCWEGPATPVTVLSPDAGGVKRAKKFQASLSLRLKREVGFAHAHKTRPSAGVIEVQEIIGPVEGRTVIAVDDMIGTGGTLKQIEQATRRSGGKLWGVAATHGLFSGENAFCNVHDINHVFISDSVTRPGDKDRRGFHIVETTTMWSEAIRRIHSDDGSISQLLIDGEANVSS